MRSPHSIASGQDVGCVKGTYLFLMVSFRPPQDGQYPANKEPNVLRILASFGTWSSDDELDKFDT